MRAVLVATMATPNRMTNTLNTLRICCALSFSVNLTPTIRRQQSRDNEFEQQSPIDQQGVAMPNQSQGAIGCNNQQRLFRWRI